MSNHVECSHCGNALSEHALRYVCENGKTQFEEEKMEAWTDIFHRTVSRNKFTSHGLAFMFVVLVALSITAMTGVKDPSVFYTVGIVVALFSPPIWEQYDASVNGELWGMNDLYSGWLFGGGTIFLVSRFF